VTSFVLNPEEALERFRETKRRLPHLSVVGFAGPGEALHSPEALFKTMDLVRREDDRITLCLSTNGLMLPFHLATLHELGLRHLTVTVNAIDEAIGAKIYAWADYFGQRHQSLAAAGLMIENQLSGIRAAKAMNMTVKVNTVLIKDINDKHIIDIARKLSKSGVDLANIMPHIPVAGSAFENFERPSQTLIRDLRFAAGAHVPQMTHCRQCRADAIGLLGQDIDLRDPIVSIPISASLKRPGYKIAVVTKSGVMVDSHFGQAERVHIYFSDGESLKLLENRKIDGLGQGCGGSCGFRDLKNRTEKPKGFIQKIISKLDDVDAVVALRIGDSPREILEEKGIKSFATMDSIENSVLAAAKKLKNESNSDITAKVARDVA
jgi:MoaA/NifB/PqqE/SkfB family radical SAM enzyme